MGVGVRVWCFTSLKVGLRSRIQVFVLVFMLRALTSRILCGRVGRVGGVGMGCVVCGGEGVVVGVRMWYACVCENFVLLMNFVLQFMCSTFDTCNGYQIHRQVRLVQLGPDITRDSHDLNSDH